jgi:outer membrane lipoprotein LolB
VRALAAVLLGVLPLAGCAPLVTRTTGTAAPTPSWAERRDQLQGLTGFALRGRVAVAAGEQGFNAALRWQQAGDRAEIALDGPFGIGGLRVAVNGPALALTTGRGQRLDGAAARGELERELGFELPLDALRYWLLGVPSPGQPAEERLEDGMPRLAGLSQDGWRIEYPDYVQTADGDRPRRLTATRGAARLRLVVESWRAADTEPGS